MLCGPAAARHSHHHLGGNDSVVVKGPDGKVQADLTGDFSGNDFTMTTKITDQEVYGTRFVQWADYDKTTKTWTSRYANNSTLEIKYQGTLTDITNIAANDKNEITFKPYVEAPEGQGDDDDDDDDDDDESNHNRACAAARAPNH